LAVGVYVIFDSKYGNTKAVAEQIAKGMREAEGIGVEIDYAKSVDPSKLRCCDGLVVGAPNHMGKPSRAIIKFVDGFSKLDLTARYAAAFDTYFQRQRYFMKATWKLEKNLSCKLPNAKLLPGFSAKVTGVNGPLAEGEMERAREFGKATAKLMLSQARTC